MAMLILAVGLLASPAMRMFELWQVYEDSAETNRKIEYVQQSLNRFFVEHGRYPCAASLTARIDSGGFGHEVLTDCTASDEPGTFRAPGRDGRTVRTGAVPVRTLGLNDSYLFDEYGNRLVYAVTEVYAVAGTVTRGDQGAIAIIDPTGNDATAEPGNVVYTVFSTGGDPNGSYSLHGVQVASCDTSKISGENCDFSSDATFKNAAFKSRNERNYFVHTMTDSASKTARPCADDGSGGGGPKDVAFIVDTSGSMGWEPSSNFCPAHMPGCSRIDVARWAMRRVVPAQVKNNSEIDEPGKTSMTGFVAYNTVSRVEDSLGNIVFDDPSAPGYEEPEEDVLTGELETRLQGMCPDNATPLGIHIQALADRLGDGDPKRPNKITVISDGESNNGINPVAAAKYVNRTYPNIQVDIVDVVGTPSLRKVASITGGKYYRSDNPDALLEDLNSSLGLCEPPTPIKPPVDKRGCGSKGSW